MNLVKFKYINKSLLFSIFSIVVPTILQICFIRFASYKIDKNILGSFILLQTFLWGLIQIFSQLVFQAYDRFYNESENKIKTINEFRTLILLLSIPSAVTIFIYGLFMKIFSFEILFLIFLLYLSISIFILEQRILLLDFERKKYLISKILEGISKFLMPIIFYIFISNLITLLFSILIGYLFSVIFFVKKFNKIIFSFLFSLKNVKKYFYYSYPFIFVAIFNWGLSFSDRYFINFLINAKAVGIYGILSMLTGMGQIIGQIYFIYSEPIILKLHSKNPNKAYKMINKFLFYLVMMSIILFVLIIFIIPKELFELLIPFSIINNNYYFNTFLVLLLSVFIIIIHTAHHMYFKLIKKLNILLYIYMIGFIINLIGNFFIKEYGIMMAAISTLIANLVILVLQILYVNYFYKGSEIDKI